MDDMQKDFSPAADADSIDDMADDMIEMTDEEGNTTLFKILDYFFYNGDEYAILTDSIDEDTTGADRVDCYVMKIVPTTDESGDVFLTQGGVFSRFLVGQTVGLFFARQFVDSVNLVLFHCRILPFRSVYTLFAIRRKRSPHHAMSTSASAIIP